MTREEKKEIISALRQLLAMCEFVDQYGDSIDADPYFNAVETVIDLLHKTEWIPVSERLPVIGDTYLVTVMVGKDIRTDVAGSFGSYIDGFWDTFNDWIEDKECHVIAWMPLPEPWKGGDSDG